MLIAAIASTVVLAVAPLPAVGLLGVLAPVGLLGVVVVTWVQMRRHDRSLCERCLTAMPLNPSEAAERYRRRLALAHLGEHPRALVAYLLLILGADLSIVLAPDGLLQVAVAGWACVQSSLIYLVLSHVTHRRLQPWCAQCGGGGGDGVDTPTPAPVDSRTG